jgi:uncharacterized protein
MSLPQSSLYVGEVVHRRFSPLKHELRYRVYNLFVDVDALPDLGLRFLSYNRFNLFGIRDRNFGDGSCLRDYIYALVKRAPGGENITRIFMFCYPNVLGYVFNPLTTYYCYDAESILRLMVYEVSNTFGERHSYVVPVDETGQQSTLKRFYVSPFNAVEGHYDFTVAPPDEMLSLGIRLTDATGPCLNAWFSGKRVALTDAALLKSFFSLPLLPLKVMGGIHWEALKLWLKGLRLQKHPVPLYPPTTVAETPKHQAPHP